MPLLSDDLRDELAAIAPRGDCDRLAELSGLFHVAGSAHLRGRGERRRPPRPRRARPSRAARSRCCARSTSSSEIRTYQRAGLRPRDPLPAPRRGLADALRRRCTTRACSIASHRPLEPPAAARVARRCCRRAYLRGALLGAGSLSGPRDPHLEIRTAELEGARFLAAVAAREGAELRVHDRGRHAAAYAKGTEAIADVLVAAGAVDVVLALEEQRRRRGDARRREPARERRPREPRAHEPRRARAARGGARSSTLDALSRTTCARSRSLRLRHPTALDRRARAPLQARRDEGVRVPAAAPAAGARGATDSSIRLASRLARLVTHESYSPRRVRARPAADSDPVRRHGLGCG